MVTHMIFSGKAAMVINITRSQEYGYYSPLTAEGTIVVNDDNDNNY